jgi:flagellar capping protein FliD
MPIRTRGSKALDKAQRRLAQFKSIHEHLDLGNGLTLDSYNHLIDKNRAALEAHNTLLSNLDESRKTVEQLDKSLSDLSERMLSGVASVYGRSSVEYAKAGGSNRKGRKPSVSVASSATTDAPQSTQSASTNGSVNGNGTTSAIY